MKLRLLVITLSSLALFPGCKAQAHSAADRAEVREQSINPDDCKVRAELVSVVDQDNSIKIKIAEVLGVGFGFQSSLYKGQIISLLYDKRIEAEIRSLKPNDKFVGVITSEQAEFENAKLILSSLSIPIDN